MDLPPLPGFLCLPAERSHWLQGRVVSSSASLALIVVDQLEQHPCLTPPDGSFVLVDVGVLDLDGGREAVVVGVERTGGALCALNANAFVASVVSFAPRRCFVDSGAVCLARTLFPEVPPVASSVVVVEGEFHIDVSALAWRPLSVGGAAAEAEASPASRTVAQLLARRWDDDCDEPAAGVGEGGSAGGGCCSHEPAALAQHMPPVLRADSEGWINPRAR